MEEPDPGNVYVEDIFKNIQSFVIAILSASPYLRKKKYAYGRSRFLCVCPPFDFSTKRTILDNRGILAWGELRFPSHVLLLCLGVIPVNSTFIPTDACLSMRHSPRFSVEKVQRQLPFSAKDIDNSEFSPL
jgi:hypothetical protein